MIRPTDSLQLVNGERYWRGLIGFVFALGIAGLLITHGSSGLLFPFSWLIALLIGVCMHELGHAVACKLAGGTVQYVQLGWRVNERKPWEIRLVGFNWHIYSAPFSGRTHGCITTTENYRARQCFFIAGGPLANLALLIPGAILLNLIKDNAWSGVLAGWVGANILLLLVSVIPRVYRKYGGPIANDGMLIWQALHYTDDDIQNHVKYAELFQHDGTESAVAERMPLTELLARHHAEPSNIEFLRSLVNKLHLMDDTRYPEFVGKLVQLPGLKTEQVAEIIDACVTWQLHVGPPSDSHLMDRLSSQLLELADSVTARGTRGSVLVDLGRLEEGKTVLHEVLATTNSTIDKAYANIFLALAEKQQGNLSLAREHAQKAATIDPACAALRRVSDLLDSKLADS